MNYKLLILLLIILIGCGPAKKHLHEEVRDESNEFKIIKLQNAIGNSVEITNYGARIVSWYVKDKEDHFRNIVLGFSTLQQYQEADAPYYGAIVGRVANRLQNFELEGKPLNLTDENFILHGGSEGFHDKFWSIASIRQNTVRLSYFSEDGAGGFPGNLHVFVEYHLTDQNELEIDYEAVVDQTTVLNLSNHAFFNLKGAGEGSVLDLQLMVNADHFTPLRHGGLPTGELRAVENSVFDFRTLKRIEETVESKETQIVLANGLDHNFVKKDNRLPLITAIDPQSGIKMEMSTTLPGVQIYTANFLSGNDKSDDGKSFKPREAICFEAQFFPDAPQHSHFPSIVLQPQEKYNHTAVYKVSLEKENNL
ncbi:aldose epimerase family protein [Flammeovirga sp. SJP92]|uniref:aldose epimerase family protein n=1 Tax=Flammeovirga sp. SJP92 TaxID=1775430 RepID=UPI001560B4FB|nr:aldose epimerase family protein [Flammeovirga sp. SJP92]